MKESGRRPLSDLCRTATKHLPTTILQVQYPVAVTLSRYAELVSRGQWSFPSYSQECPICGAHDCAIRCGYYRRQVIVVFAVIEILVARYRCRRKGRAAKGAHLTFSLLPQEVHPYSRYSSTAGYAVVKETLRRSLTTTLMAFAASLGNLGISTIYRMLQSFRSAVSRLVEAGWLEQIPADWRRPLVVKADAYADGILGIKQEFYVRQCRFLLGTPSQLR